VAFRFNFEALLRLRRSLERQQELLLQAVNYDVMKIQQRIRCLEDWRATLELSETDSLTGGTAAAELQFNCDLSSALLRQEGELQKQLLSLEKTRDQRCASLKEARRQREIFENLRDQQIRVYRMYQTRKDQRAIDDFFLMRRSSVLAAGSTRKNT
jgi:flagellar export protein FliJ